MRKAHSANRRLILIGTVFILLLSGCSVILTRVNLIATSERDQQLSTQGLGLSAPVTVRWNKHRMPFIEASSDEDAFFTMGYLHAHLRLAQLEIFRHVSQGRLSEVAGPVAVDIDKALRVLAPGRASDKIISEMPEQTLLWVNQFLAGLNAYIARVKELPADLKLLGKTELQPWSLKELVTFWRLAAIDVNWMYFVSYLGLREKPGFEQLWIEVQKFASPSIESFSSTSKTQQVLWNILKETGKWGSNSVVISGKKSETGAAMISNDPHLGISLPNLWLLLGVKSPSFHMAGLMIPGMPFIALGRNPQVSWGGTNMRALSSYLYEVNDQELKEAEWVKEKIKVRFWFDKEFRYRRLPGASLLTEAPFFSDLKKPVKLVWEGYKSSDEVTAFFKANRAENWQDFRAAFESYAVSAQNILYADSSGHIGHLLAIRSPRRKDNSRRELVSRAEDNPLVESIKSTDLPAGYDPKEGFLASANNRPTQSVENLGWFYSTNDRIKRLRSVLSKKDKVSLGDLKELHQDVYSSSSHQLAQAMVEWAKGHDLKVSSKVLDLISGWDGHYSVESKGALMFELVAAVWAESLYTQRYKNEDWVKVLIGRGAWKDRFMMDLPELDPKDLHKDILKRTLQAQEVFAKYKTWGAYHKMPIAHWFGAAPLVGSRFQFGEYPTAGSGDTLMKTAFSSGRQPAKVVFGANSRHISDMSDLDENYFLLFGGNDGWMKSPQSTDQIDLWRRGEYIRVPLSAEGRRQAFSDWVVELK